MKAFREAFGPELRTEEAKGEIQNTLGTGSNLGLTMILDKKSVLSTAKQYAEKQNLLGSFRIGFSVAGSPFAIQSQHLKVRLGYRTDVRTRDPI